VPGESGTDSRRIHVFAEGAEPLSGHTTASISATPMPMNTSAHRCKAICHGGAARGINSTIARVTPPNRYALRSERATAQSNPRMNTAAPNTSAFRPKWLATIAPTAAPSAVPRKRCRETASAAPNDDCVMTRVVIGAQYASGSRNKRATSTETTAASAVRAECTTTGKAARSTLSQPKLMVVAPPFPRLIFVAYGICAGGVFVGRGRPCSSDRVLPATCGRLRSLPWLRAGARNRRGSRGGGCHR